MATLEGRHGKAPHLEVDLNQISRSSVLFLLTAHMLALAEASTDTSKGETGGGDHFAHWALLVLLSLLLRAVYALGRRAGRVSAMEGSGAANFEAGIAGVLENDLEEPLAEPEIAVPAVPAAHPARRLVADAIYVAPSGEKFHLRRDCRGLRSARSIKALGPCAICAQADGRR